MPYPKKMTPAEKAKTFKKGNATAKKVVKKAVAAKKAAVMKKRGK
jgi:hypothetical protein